MEGVVGVSGAIGGTLMSVVMKDTVVVVVVVSSGLRQRVDGGTCGGDDCTGYGVGVGAKTSRTRGSGRVDGFVVIGVVVGMIFTSDLVDQCGSLVLDRIHG